MGDDIQFNEHWAFRGVPENLQAGLMLLIFLVALIVTFAILLLICKLCESRSRRRNKGIVTKKAHIPELLNSRYDPEIAGNIHKWNELEMHRSGMWLMLATKLPVLVKDHKPVHITDETSKCVVVPNMDNSDIYKVPLLQAQYQ